MCVQGLPEYVLRHPGAPGEVSCRGLVFPGNTADSKGRVCVLDSLLGPQLPERTRRAGVNPTPNCDSLEPRLYLLRRRGTSSEGLVPDNEADA